MAKRGGKYAGSTEVTFEYQHYLPATSDECRVITTDERGIQLLISSLRYVFYARSRWINNGELVTDPGLHSIIVGWGDKLLGELIMSCDLKDVLDQQTLIFDRIADAMEMGALGGGDGGCGCGSGGAGANDPPPSSVDVGDPGGPEGTPPPGFDTWAEWVIWKCNVATFIVDSLISDIHFFQTVSIVNLTIGGLALGLASLVPGVGIAVILAVLIAIVGIELTIFDDVENALVNNYDDLLCALFEGENAQESKDQFFTVFESAMATEAANAVNEALGNQLIRALIWWESVNRMWEYDAGFEQELPSGDCSACSIAEWWDCLTGTKVSHTATTVIVNPTIAEDGEYLCAVGVNDLDTLGEVSWELLSGTLTPPAVWNYISADDDTLQCGAGGGTEWSHGWMSFFNRSPYDLITTLQIRSDTDFQMKFTVEFY